MQGLRNLTPCIPFLGGVRDSEKLAVERVDTENTVNNGPTKEEDEGNHQMADEGVLG